jgi:hypothetical protein
MGHFGRGIGRDRDGRFATCQSLGRAQSYPKGNRATGVCLLAPKPLSMLLLGAGAGVATPVPRSEGCASTRIAMLPRAGSACPHVFWEDIILMRGVTGPIAIIGAAFGEIINVAFPELFKHIIYGYIADFLDRIVSSWWASMIAFIIEHAIIAAGGIGLVALAYSLGVVQRQAVVPSGIMPTDPPTRSLNITPMWLAAAVAVAVIITIAFMTVITNKDTVPLSEIRLNILHAYIYPPGDDNKKNPAGALIEFSPANNHPIVGVSHNAQLKFYEKIISKQEEDAQMKIVEAPMLPPRREGNEVPPGQAPSFSIYDPNITIDEWKNMTQGNGMIYIFAIAKYYGTENAEKIRVTEFCRFITRTPLVLHSCDSHNRIYTQE